MSTRQEYLALTRTLCIATYFAIALDFVRKVISNSHTNTRKDKLAETWRQKPDEYYRRHPIDPNDPKVKAALAPLQKVQKEMQDTIDRETISECVQILKAYGHFLSERYSNA
jgi:hypothetical protein